MLSDVIKAENIIVELESSEKDDLFAEMLESLVRSYPNIDREEAMTALIVREEKMNTCVMKGIAVPHANCSSIKEPVAALGISKQGIDYDSDFIDTETSEKIPVHIVIMILFEQGNAGSHLKLLTECASVMQKPEFYKEMLSAKNAADVFNIISECE